MKTRCLERTLVALVALVHAIFSAQVLAATLDLAGVNTTLPSAPVFPDSYLSGVNNVTNSGAAASLSEGGGPISPTAFFGVIADGAGAVSLIHTSGTTAIYSTNSYSGGTVILGGSLYLGGFNSLGSGMVSIANGATLGAAGVSITVPNAVSLSGSTTMDVGSNVVHLSGPISGSGALAFLGLGNLVLDVANSYSGGTTVAEGSLFLFTNTSAGTGSIALADQAHLYANVNGTVLGNTISVTGAAYVYKGTGTLTLNGTISGSGQLLTGGTGNLIVNGANSHSGGTTIGTGTLTVGTSTAAGTGTLVIANGTTLAAGANGLVLANALTTAGAASVNSGPGTFTLNGAIDGSASLLSVGLGTLILNGASSDTRTLAVSNGTVLVNGVQPATEVQVDGSGRLGGTGTVGAVSLAVGAHLAPGASAGILRTSDLNMPGGTHFDVELNGFAAGSGYDQASVTGNVALGAMLNVTLGAGFTPFNGEQFVIINNDAADAVVGIFSGLPESANLVVGTVTFAISYVGGTGNDVVLTVLSGGGLAPASLGGAKSRKTHGTVGTFDLPL